MEPLEPKVGASFDEIKTVPSPYAVIGHGSLLYLEAKAPTFCFVCTEEKLANRAIAVTRGRAPVNGEFCSSASTPFLSSLLLCFVCGL